MDGGLRSAGLAGMVGAVATLAAGVVHPKGSSDVGTLEEWLTRVGNSRIWVLDHFVLLVAAVLLVIAARGITHSYPEAAAREWAHRALTVTVASTALTAIAFLVDGPVLKEAAERWQEAPGDAAVLGASRAITEIGFILVAGFQLVVGIAASLFACAGLTTSAHPRVLGWLAAAAGVTAIVPASAHYLAGASTWSVSLVYVSSGLFSAWTFAMAWRLWRGPAVKSVTAVTNN